MICFVLHRARYMAFETVLRLSPEIPDLGPNMAKAGGQ